MENGPHRACTIAGVDRVEKRSAVQARQVGETVQLHRCESIMAEKPLFGVLRVLTPEAR